MSSQVRLYSLHPDYSNQLVSRQTTTSPLLPSSLFFETPALTRRNAFNRRRSSCITPAPNTDTSTNLAFYSAESETASFVPAPSSSPTLAQEIFTSPVDANELRHLLLVLDAATPATSPILSNGLEFGDAFAPASSVSFLNSHGLPPGPADTTSTSINQLSSKLDILEIFEGMLDLIDTPSLEISSPTGSGITFNSVDDLFTGPDACDEVVIASKCDHEPITRREGSDAFGLSLYAEYTFGPRTSSPGKYYEFPAYPSLGM
jgi:hypothetical protein